MLEIGKANAVKFQVGVNGTAAEPLVRVVLSLNGIDFGFPSERVIGSNTDWFSEVKIPEDVVPGNYAFRVEVVINNRLFTPLKRTIAIGVKEPLVAARPPETLENAPVAEQVVIAQVKPVVKQKQPLIKVFAGVPTITAPIKITMADVVKESNQRFEKALSESQTYKKPGISAKPININPQVPVTLKKGEVVYE